ncbi:MAG TPA: ABC transporter ATP-binding protein [Gemmatimonadaceae bacterium]|nr:ABC transporter ATP-binding protein [Gemmatimonadaceae bacterium]
MSMLPMSIDGPTAIRAAGVSKRYAKRTALDRFDLAVPDGSIYLLAGPNGAGKSTAIRHMLHLEEPDAGTITVLGHDVRRDAVRARAEIGYISDGEVTPYGWLRVGALVAHHAQYFPTWDAQYASRLIAELDIDLAPRVRALSRGEARRIAFVLALAHRPALLLLDEPTDGLDPVVRERVLHLLAEHASEAPTTMLVSTHLVHEVERLADHVGIIKKGRLIGQMPRDYLRGTLNRYRFDAPDSWRVPEQAPVVVVERVAAGRENEWTMWGEPGVIRAMFDAGETELRSVTPLTLADAVVALLSMEDAA